MLPLNQKSTKVIRVRNQGHVPVVANRATIISSCMATKPTSVRKPGSLLMTNMKVSGVHTSHGLPKKDRRPEEILIPYIKMPNGVQIKQIR